MGDSLNAWNSRSLQSGLPTSPAAPPLESGTQDADPVERLASVDPAFAAELETLSIPIDEYERMLSQDAPSIVTTDNTVG